MQIELPKRRRKTTEVRIPECWICMDKGFILYKDNEYREFVLHCICPRGTAYSYSGKRIENSSCSCYVPSVEEKFDKNQLIADNFYEWWNVYRNIEGYREELIRRGIPIEKLE